MFKVSGKVVEITGQNLSLNCDHISTTRLARNIKFLINCVNPRVFTHFITHSLTVFSTQLITEINLIITSFTHFTHSFITTITNLLIKRRTNETNN